MKHAKIKKLLLYLAVAVIVICTLLPYIWLIVSSISQKVDLISTPPHFFAHKPSLDNYKTLFLGTSNQTTDAASQFVSAFKNSFVVSITVTAFAMMIGVPAAFAFSRSRRKTGSIMMHSILGFQMIPPITLIIPMYIIITQVHMLDHLLTLIIVYLSFVVPYVIWIMKGYFDSVPKDLEEMAKVDGCSNLQALLKIVLPVSFPGISSTLIFTFILAWNEFFYALNFTLTTNSKTLPVLITEFSSKLGTDYIMTSTAGVVASLPPVLLALFFQKFIISGLSSGSIKE